MWLTGCLASEATAGWEDAPVPRSPLTEADVRAHLDALHLAAAVGAVLVVLLAVVARP